ncbi:palmitoyl protein thioesterase [Martensiomyces pterosporus]|nr:palmitoyl protein thioesterase [Martensiomyces pterosporus]
MLFASISRIALCTGSLSALLASAAGAHHSFDSPTPVVIWHGMGDTCCTESMGFVTKLIEDEMPGVFVHSVQLGSSESADRNAGFFGNINDQLALVCDDLSSIDELQQGVNLLGFSQGGLFLRALVQRCPAIQANTLVTFGSPHTGVAKVPECENKGDVLCQWMRQLAARGVYSWYIRDHVIQAQYFKDPSRVDQYLQYNIFLPDINAELDERNEAYRDRILALDKMVLVRFSNESMISPPSSSWFGFVDEEDNEIPLQNTTLYTDDWLGLRELDEGGKLAFLTLEGKHMQIDEASLRDIVSKYFAPHKERALRVQD